MRRELLTLLCCPLCRGALALAAAEERGEEVWEGALTCEACARRYPIHEGIPDLVVEAPAGPTQTDA